MSEEEWEELKTLLFQDFVLFWEVEVLGLFVVRVNFAGEVVTLAEDHDDVFIVLTSAGSAR